MVTIIRLTNKPCFLCNSAKDTVEVRFKDRTFSGVVCMEHLFQLLRKRTEAANKTSSSTSQEMGQTGGKCS